MPWIRFRDFELNEQTFELRKDGLPAKIQQQPARVLALLVARQGMLVSRSEIRNAIWGEETFVDFEQGLNFCIRQIRLVLNDNAENPQFLETLPRLGYRFIAPAERGDETKAFADRPRLPSRLRIALLPIRYLEGDAEDYFTIGLTEDMISALARLDSERLRVVLGPRLQQQEIDEACLDRLQRELALDYLLRISARRSGESIRISAQLHDLKDKSVLWSETYDRKSSDLPEVQGEVAGRVSRSLAVELLQRPGGGSAKYARSAAAYDAYLKGPILLAQDDEGGNAEQHCLLFRIHCHRSRLCSGLCGSRRLLCADGLCQGGHDEAAGRLSQSETAPAARDGTGRYIGRGALHAWPAQELV